MARRIMAARAGAGECRARGGVLHARMVDETDVCRRSARLYPLPHVLPAKGGDHPRRALRGARRSPAWCPDTPDRGRVHPEDVSLSGLVDMACLRLSGTAVRASIWSAARARASRRGVPVRAPAAADFRRVL